MLHKKFNLSINSKINSFNKTIHIDSDKSISIRSFLIGSMTHNISKVKNVLESEDVMSTINCLKKLGVKIKKKGGKEYCIYGKGLGSLRAKKYQTKFWKLWDFSKTFNWYPFGYSNINVLVNGDHSSIKYEKNYINIKKIWS